MNRLPEGLSDVSRYPHLFAELMTDPSWSDDDLQKLAGQNLLRVMKEVEEVSKISRIFYIFLKKILNHISYQIL